jgi:hypothetical protein
MPKHTVTVNTKFYTYRQNNSGGSFIGPLAVIIEAKNADEADALAEHKAGVYFNGCDDGRDCSCCGDRWGRASDSYHACESPALYGETDPTKWEGFMGDEEAKIYFYDGTEKTIKLKKWGSNAK